MKLFLLVVSNQLCMCFYSPYWIKATRLGKKNWKVRVMSSNFVISRRCLTENVKEPPQIEKHTCEACKDNNNWFSQLNMLICCIQGCSTASLRSTTRRYSKNVAQNCKVKLVLVFRRYVCFFNFRKLAELPRKWILGSGVKVRKENHSNSRLCVHVLCKTWETVISRRRFAKNGKELYRN